ncbi:DUF1906 domain-containing protein [Speluncibacter jeojiensis]|uniref:DUF1906 domain-containing protein n=1 Tax=Speluncibacter jeojiensis TaxID=2710754 RepID=A0A9X4M544_9ACTN|nr:DUF1906 domain-containing protein [Corynebacteriales bacterium D3-21]
MQVSRRDLFRYVAAGSAALGVGGVLGSGALAQAASLGTLVDYAAGVPDAAAIRAAGHIGAIRYVSDRRAGAEWMTGKPMLAGEADALRAAGLSVVSCYQYGKGATADWRGGTEAGKRHAERGLALHRAAGGPDDAPIYASIDDNPTRWQFESLIAGYLRGWESVVGSERTGVYANAPTIDWASAAGVGRYFWQHNWGTAPGYVHPAAHLHQFEIDQRSIEGIGIDVNRILEADYGQWR